MQAFRERTKRLQEERDRRRTGEIVTAIFEPLQNLHRSADAWKKMELSDEALKGMDLVLQQFQSALQKLGLEEISAVGAPFDPNIHEAICAVDVQEAAQDGVVLQVFENGYQVGSHIIRAARVVIGRYQEQEQEQEQD